MIWIFVYRPALVAFSKLQFRNGSQRDTPCPIEVTGHGTTLTPTVVSFVSVIKWDMTTEDTNQTYSSLQLLPCGLFLHLQVGFYGTTAPPGAPILYRWAQRRDGLTLVQSKQKLEKLAITLENTVVHTCNLDTGWTGHHTFVFVN